MHFHAAAFAADQAGFAQGFKVLRKRGFWYRNFVDREKGGTRLGAIGEGNLCKNCSADRVGESVKLPAAKGA